MAAEPNQKTQNQVVVLSDSIEPASPVGHAISGLTQRPAAQPGVFRPDSFAVLQWDYE